MNSKRVFVAVAAVMAISAAGAKEARADLFGDIAKAVGNVLTGGMISMVEGVKKAAKGKAKAGDILNIVTGGAAGAIRSAAKIGHTVHKGVHSAIQGIGNMASNLFKRMGVNLPRIPGLPSLPGMGGKGPAGLPKQILQAFGNTFTKVLPGLFGKGGRRGGLRPGAGLFRAAGGAVTKALAAARSAALSASKRLGIKLPNLGGLTSFIQKNFSKGFGLARQVALGKTARRKGQFVRILAPGSIRTAFSRFAKTHRKLLARPVRGRGRPVTVRRPGRARPVTVRRPGRARPATVRRPVRARGVPVRARGVPVRARARAVPVR